MATTSLEMTTGCQRPLGDGESVIRQLVTQLSEVTLVDIRRDDDGVWVSCLYPDSDDVEAGLEAVLRSAEVALGTEIFLVRSSDEE